MPEDEKNPVAGLQALLAKANGDAMGVAGLLYSENFQYREQLRQLKEQLQAAQGQVPGEGAVVLTPEQAKAWTAYQGLGTVEVITQGLKERETALGELGSLRRATTLREAAETCGFDADVLGTLAGGLEFVLQDVTAEGKTVKAAFVKDAQGAQVRLEEYARQKWEKFTPALIPAAGRGQGSASGGQWSGASGQQGTRMPTQGTGGGQGAPDVVAAFLQAQEKAAAARSNPLLPKT